MASDALPQLRDALPGGAAGELHLVLVQAECRGQLPGADRLRPSG